MITLTNIPNTILPYDKYYKHAKYNLISHDNYCKYLCLAFMIGYLCMELMFGYSCRTLMLGYSCVVFIFGYLCMVSVEVDWSICRQSRECCCYCCHHFCHTCHPSQNLGQTHSNGYTKLKEHKLANTQTERPTYTNKQTYNRII